MQYPELLEHADTGNLGDVFPSDVVARARALLKETGSVGAYSSNYAFHHVRELVANYIGERDGFPS